MKVFTAFVFLVLLCSRACKRDDITTLNTSLTGKWRLAGSMVSAGGPLYFVPSPAKADYDYVTFNPSYTLSGTVFTDYKTYAVKDSTTLTVTKADQTTYQNYIYKIKADSLTLSPAGPIYCVEGCAMKFVKVAE